jgi:hypothetical protein
MNQFNEDYFLRGKETGVSLYQDYRWLPELTVPMCRAIAEHLQMPQGDLVLDFGCARGYVVKAMRQLGYFAYGYDVSEWAIANTDREVYQFCSNNAAVAFSDTIYDWVIAKDVLEHIPFDQLGEVVCDITNVARKGIFVVVPLSEDEETYIVPDYDKDVTHCNRLNLVEWASMFIRPGWVVEARYRLKGVKDNYSDYPNGNGFLTCRRLD